MQEWIAREMNEPKADTFRWRQDRERNIMCTPNSGHSTWIEIHIFGCDVRNAPHARANNQVILLRSGIVDVVTDIAFDQSASDSGSECTFRQRRRMERKISSITFLEVYRIRIRVLYRKGNR